MPSAFYAGDNTVTRAAAASLITRGDIGVPYAQKQDLAGFTEPRGQYWYENDARQKLFSKYGIGYALLYVPPLLVEKLYAGHLELMCGTRSLLLILNAFGILLTLLATFYLFRIVSLYTEKSWSRVAFVIFSWYGTFAWHYLRAPSHEILQIPAFLGFCYYALRFLRRQTGEDRAARERGHWFHLLAGVLWCGALLLMKGFFLLALGSLWVFALVSLAGDRPAGGVKGRFGRHVRKAGLYLLLPTAIVMLLWMGTNAYKFGDVFRTGYGQWLTAEGIRNDRFGPAFLPGALAGFFLRKGNANVFVHYPLLLLALVGLPRFVKRRPLEAAFLFFMSVTSILAICCFSNWRGEWCYGPRYLVHFLIIASLPAAGVVEAVFGRGRRGLACTVVAVAVVVFTWSFRMQWRVNRLNYFAYHNAKQALDQVAGLVIQHNLAAVPAHSRQQAGTELEAKRSQINAYFSDVYHRGRVYRDLVEFYEHGSMFPAVQSLKAMLPPVSRLVEDQIRPQMQPFVQSNFWFFDSSGGSPPAGAGQR